MKQSALILCFALLFLSFSVFSQNDSLKTQGIFYKFSVATTLKDNEHWAVELSEDQADAIFEDENELAFIVALLDLETFIINNTVGYQFDERTSLTLNFDYEWYSRIGLHFFPAYLGLQYNILHFENCWEDGKIYQSNLFLQGGYGTLLSLGKSFEKGNFIKLGIGYQAEVDDSNNSIIIGFDFTRRRFGYETLEGMSSLSIFLGFILF